MVDDDNARLTFRPTPDDMDRLAALKAALAHPVLGTVPSTSAVLREALRVAAKALRAG